MARKLKTDSHATVCINLPDNICKTILDSRPASSHNNVCICQLCFPYTIPQAACQAQEPLAHHMDTTLLFWDATLPLLTAFSHLFISLSSLSFAHVHSMIIPSILLLKKFPFHLVISTQYLLV